MKIKNILGVIVLICVSGLVALVFFQINILSAAPNLQDAFKGQDGGKSMLDKTAENAGFASEGANIETMTLEYRIADIIQIVLSFLGVIFLILIIYAGFIWMTARGNEQQAEKAKNILIAAVIGFLIVISAYAISYLIMLKLGAGTLKAS